MKNRLRRLYIFIVAAVTVLFVMLVSTDIYFKISSVRKYTLKTELPLVGLAAISSFDTLALRYKSVGETLLSDNFIRDWILDGEKEADSLVSFMNNIRSKNELLDASLISDITETYYGTDGRILQLSPDNEERDGWYYFYRKQMPGNNIDSWYYPEEDIVGLFVNIPVTDYEGRYIGLTGGGIDSTVFDALLHEFEVEWEIDIFIVRSDGQLVYASDRKYFESKYNFVDDIWQFPVFDLITRWKNQPAGKFVISEEDKLLLWSSYMPEWDSYFIIERNNNVLSNRVMKYINRSLIIEVLISGLVLSFAIVILNIIFARLNSSVEVRKKIVGRWQAGYYFQNILTGRAIENNSWTPERISGYNQALNQYMIPSKIEPDPAECDLNEIINDYFIEKSPAAAEKKVEMISRLHSGSSVVTEHGKLLRFIIGNILDRAIDNANHGSEVLIVSVKNTGGLYLEAVFTSRTITDEEIDFTALQSFLEDLNISVSVVKTGAEKFIFKFNFY